MQTKSFNTVGRSNLSSRKRRKKYATYVRLAILFCIPVLAIAMMVYGIVALFVGNNEPESQPETVVEYDTLTVSESHLTEGTLILVNKSHKLEEIPETSDLKQLATCDEYTVNSERSLYLWESAYEALNTMMQKYHSIFPEEKILVSDAFRTLEEQSKLSKQASAGYSDHHSGYLLTLNDQNGDDLEEENWFTTNGYKYGFVQRYPSDKSRSTDISGYTSAYRYVGVAHSKYMHDQNLSLEEYVNLLKKDYSEDVHLLTEGADGLQYEIFYAESVGEVTNVKIPQNRSGYEISGTNDGGFIITVCLSENSK